MSEPTKLQQADQPPPQRLRLAQALRHVFGHQDERNEDQRLVWDWLQANCFVRQSTIALGTDNVIDPCRMAMHEGARRVALAIDAEIRWVTTPPENRPHVAQRKDT